MFPISDPITIFLLVLMIILLGPAVFRPLRIPPVVGMIIAGVLVGPYGFNLLERDASFRIFGEVGILYLMFTAAVEIDMFHLRRNYRHGVVFGLLSFALPMAAGIFVARQFFGAGWDTAVLLASMLASHTLVSYPAVSRFGLQNTRGAVLAVCGTIVAVLLALFCLAGVVAARETGSFSGAILLRLFVKMVIFALGVGYLFPWAARRFFSTTSDGVAQYIFVLALVFTASMLARLAGLEAILGAFYAGLVLNPLLPARSRLMKNIKFVGDSIFIPYFLIGVGMLIDVRVVIEGWDVVRITALMTATALAMKWLAAYISRRIFSLDRDEGMLMFGLTGGKAAATIAAVMVGYDYNILTEDMMNGAVIMILLCCVVASVATENAARRIRIRLTQSDLDRSEVGEREFARQVVAVANPMTAEGLMSLAISMRSRENRHEATALFVRNDSSRRTVAMGRNALAAATAVGEAMDVRIQDVERIDPSIAGGIRTVAEERHATEILIGFHRKSNIVDTFFGSMTEQLLQTSNRMVFMSRCFVPVETVSRIFTLVPPKAEYETGFHLWVSRITTLGANIEASVTFICSDATAEFIRTVIAEDRIEVNFNFRRMESWDEFIVLSGEIADEDLFVVVGARKGSISWHPDLDDLPSYLSRHFSRHNLLVTYPKQF